MLVASNLNNFFTNDINQITYKNFLVFVNILYSTFVTSEWVQNSLKFSQNDLFKHPYLNDHFNF